MLIRFVQWLGALKQALLVDQWRKIQEEVDSEARDKVAWKVPLVMCWGAVILTVLEYYGSYYAWLRSPVYKWITGNALSAWLYTTQLFMAFSDWYAPFSGVSRHAFWSLSCSASYFLLPALVIFLTRGDRIRDYGLSLKNFRHHLWIYVLLFLIVLPAVIGVSYFRSFQGTYPFYRLAGRSMTDLSLWWIFYGIQFFCLEFFFRGYLLQGTKKALGAYAIFFSAVPYCMIHFGKPMPETLGAIIAGVALGTLAMRTRSVWSGFLIHISVAFSMDILSLWQKGKFSIFM